MKKNNLDTVSFYDLPWDTNFFGVHCAKAVLHKPLTLSQWNELKSQFNNYQFITIENRNSEIQNSKLIGKDTSAFLADVNIQFVKKISKKIEYELENSYEQTRMIEIHQALKYNSQVIELADFSYSRFKEDIELAHRGGNQIYRQWIVNAFEKPDKYFALSKNEKNQINGFLLFSYQEKACVIELIAAAKHLGNHGIGSRLFKSIEQTAYKDGYEEIRVGTQVKNIKAINFYHKSGCSQVGSHQVYHLWNL